MRKTAFLRFINLKPKFCFWGLHLQTSTGGLPLDPAGGLSSPTDSLKPAWTLSHKNPATSLLAISVLVLGLVLNFFT